MANQRRRRKSTKTEPRNTSVGSILPKIKLYSSIAAVALLTIGGVYYATVNKNNNRSRTVEDIERHKVLEEYFKNIGPLIDKLKKGRNIFLFGTTGVGKTTLIKDLVGDMEATPQVPYGNPGLISDTIGANAYAIDFEEFCGRTRQPRSAKQGAPDTRQIVNFVDMMGVPDSHYTEDTQGRYVKLLSKAVDERPNLVIYVADDSGSMAHKFTPDAEVPNVMNMLIEDNTKIMFVISARHNTGDERIELYSRLYSIFADELTRRFGEKFLRYKLVWNGDVQWFVIEPPSAVVRLQRTLKDRYSETLIKAKSDLKILREAIRGVFC